VAAISAVLKIAAASHADSNLAVQHNAASTIVRQTLRMPLVPRPSMPPKSRFFSPASL